MEELLRRELGCGSVRATGYTGGGCISQGRSYDTDRGRVFVKVNSKAETGLRPGRGAGLGAGRGRRFSLPGAPCGRTVCAGRAVNRVGGGGSVGASGVFAPPGNCSERERGYSTPAARELSLGVPRDVGRVWLLQSRARGSCPALLAWGRAGPP
ncbi:hypothetical protein P7K49_012213 [Saguinus oedipus]|uniref:Protein-ribulosamine 3-kinase n=1 Tax=Saguinus oedipus TaxID=9490 RepID=A0ABQ9VST2_SAGOE|nr:hypothetical protein P7K49_012213 [Saguinus oedipus]